MQGWLFRMALCAKMLNRLICLPDKSDCFLYCNISNDYHYELAPHAVDQADEGRFGHRL
jgi:hypothetical protein